MSRAASGAAAAAQVRVQRVDWRLERMASLTDLSTLEGEWDPERLLLVPRPGGHLTRVPPCQVAGCPRVRHGAKPLCSGHLHRFRSSGIDDIDEWLASGEPLLNKRWCSEETCVVTDSAGRRCPRPVVGTRDLCHGHGQLWADQPDGTAFEEFLARARPMPSFGPCVAASCYLEAAHKHSRLCTVHYTIWGNEGRPSGRAFDAWAAVVRQPANGLVLSLRGLPELVRLELLFAACCRVSEQIRTATWNMRPFVDRLRHTRVASVTDFDPVSYDREARHDYGRFARFAVDRVQLAYGDAETERCKDIWDLRLFGHSGRHVDFRSVHQNWLREATKGWAGTTLVRTRSPNTVQQRVQSVSVLSQVLASGRGGGHDPAALGRGDIERFLLRARSIKSPQTDQPYSARRVAGIIEDCSFVLREAREMGLLPSLAPTFTVRRGDGGRSQYRDAEEPGRALPPRVVAQLDAQLGLLRETPGTAGGPRHRSLGVLGEQAGEMAVLIYQILKGTGRRVGEVASLHLECLDVDEHGKAVLVYDNHKAMRMRRRLPIADSALVDAIRAQQRWVAERFPVTPTEQLWLLPRANKNARGTAHIGGLQIRNWMRYWVDAIPRLDAGTLDESGAPVPFDRSLVHPHAFRHTYCQTLADEGVPAPVLRDLMDHESIDTSLGYYRDPRELQQVQEKALVTWPRL